MTLLRLFVPCLAMLLSILRPCMHLYLLLGLMLSPLSGIVLTRMAAARRLLLSLEPGNRFRYERRFSRAHLQSVVHANPQINR